ncbi:hypothetical protein I7I51_04433 [Histoplasma capsulatum]|uniref:Uncharacterized protein n=1 Tax=Ajellomyces capsulatus TaxID=5037 RepID=A0A8A1M6X7_AJECA|nr:hypothetical protein I7I51_04433 [Histoplasma capsulatum]
MASQMSATDKRNRMVLPRQAQWYWNLPSPLQHGVISDRHSSVQELERHIPSSWLFVTEDRTTATMKLQICPLKETVRYPQSDSREADHRLSEDTSGFGYVKMSSAADASCSNNPLAKFSTNPYLGPVTGSARRANGKFIRSHRGPKTFTGDRSPLVPEYSPIDKRVRCASNYHTSTSSTFHHSALVSHRMHLGMPGQWVCGAGEALED